MSVDNVNKGNIERSSHQSAETSINLLGDTCFSGNDGKKASVQNFRNAVNEMQSRGELTCLPDLTLTDNQTGSSGKNQSRFTGIDMQASSARAGSAAGDTQLMAKAMPNCEDGSDALTRQQLRLDEAYKNSDYRALSKISESYSKADGEANHRSPEAILDTEARIGRDATNEALRVLHDRQSTTAQRKDATAFLVHEGVELEKSGDRDPAVENAYKGVMHSIHNEFNVERFRPKNSH